MCLKLWTEQKLIECWFHNDPFLVMPLMYHNSKTDHIIMLISYKAAFKKNKHTISELSNMTHDVKYILI